MMKGPESGSSSRSVAAGAGGPARPGRETSCGGLSAGPDGTVPSCPRLLVADLGDRCLRGASAVLPVTGSTVRTAARRLMARGIAWTKAVSTGPGRPGVPGGRLVNRGVHVHRPFDANCAGRGPPAGVTWPSSRFPGPEPRCPDALRHGVERGVQGVEDRRKCAYEPGHSRDRHGQPLVDVVGRAAWRALRPSGRYGDGCRVRGALGACGCLVVRALPGGPSSEGCDTEGARPFIRLARRKAERRHMGGVVVSTRRLCLTILICGQ